MATETAAISQGTTLPQSEVSAVIPDAPNEKTAAGPIDTSAAASTTVPAATAAAPATESLAVSEKKTDTTASATTSTPLQQLWGIAKAQGHPEIWGVTLDDPDSHIPSQVVFQKYLNANDGDLAKAKDQLVKTLEWRAKMKPLTLMDKHFSKTKFDGLGYVTSYIGPAVDGSTRPHAREVFTWNVYGTVKKFDETFGNLEEFIEWRVALMELALRDLSLTTATKPITATDDRYKIYQVHDYKNISFFRSPPVVRTASSETIKVFAQNYPELLKEKFFINVPAIMGFMYALMKVFVAPKTIKKFHPMSNGGALANEFGTGSTVQGLGAMLPKEYGGKGDGLQTTGTETLLE